MKDTLLGLAASKQWSRRPTCGPSKVTEVLAVDGLAQTYDVFEDRHSRDLFVKLLLYRMLGARKVKLPTNSPNYWEKIEEAKQYLRKKNVIQGVPIVGSLDLYGFETIELICHLMNVVNTFLLEQYRCERAGVRTEPGDVTIDAGGCWGDTALYFARQAECVYCYECIPSNIAIMKRNLALNPQLAKNIFQVSKALSREAGVTLNFADTGPGSHSVDTGFQVQTDSIDNLVERNHLRRVDFIKMDIEGAEMDALMGAERTIRTHRPRLAISIYHSLQDFVRIPRWIASLDVGYRIYLDHFTIHEEETVLFARSDSQVRHGL
jgi:FkbM family methyltransferase